MVGSRLLVVCRLLMGSMLLLKRGSNVVLFMFLLVEVVETSLMLGSKVLGKAKACQDFVGVFRVTIGSGENGSSHG